MAKRGRPRNGGIIVEPLLGPDAPLSARMILYGPRFLNAVADHLASEGDWEALDRIVKAASVEYIEFLKKPRPINPPVQPQKDGE